MSLDNSQTLQDQAKGFKIKKEAVSYPVDSDLIQILLLDSTPWALVNRSVSDLRREPRNLSERVSQGLLGESVRILQGHGEWSWVRMEHDGYMGWMHTAALYPCSQEDVTAYQASCKWLVLDELLPATAQPVYPTTQGADEEVHWTGKLPFGIRLPLEGLMGNSAQVRLPDGQLCWVQASGLLSMEDCPKPDLPGINLALKRMQRLTGVPYLWGGRTPFGYDCSGLSQMFLSFLGIHAPRDADQQYRAGEPVAGDPQPGDLLFFGEQRTTQPQARFASITHVGISLGGEQIIHANGATWSVAINSLDPREPTYRAWLRENLVGVRRFK